MPCFATFACSGGTERAAARPSVKLLVASGVEAEGATGTFVPFAWPGVQVLEIVHSAGLTPGRAKVLVRDLQETPPVLFALNALPPHVLPAYSRIQVMLDGECLFLGNLVGRHSEARGALLLEYEDDRVLLARLPVHGAWVRSARKLPGGGEVAAAFFNPRYAPCFNPGGQDNCEWLTVGDERVPLFSRLASAPEDDAAAHWTPAAILAYLRHYLTAPPDAYPEWLGLDPAKLVWPAETLRFSAPAMHAKCPNLSVQGQAALAVLCKALELGGAYGLNLKYRRDGKSEIELFPRSPEPGTPREVLTVQVSGAVAEGDLRGVEDFSGGEDAREAITEVLVEGAAPAVEAQFEWTTAPAASTLVPAWSAEEEAAFRTLIAAAPNQPSERRQALRQARARFPRVFCAYKLPGDETEGDAAAVAALLGGRTLFPLTRPPLPEQLQRLGGPRTPRFPIRVQVYSSAGAGDPEWRDVTANTGLLLDDEGLLWFCGLTDDAAQDPADLIYSGDLVREPEQVSLRPLRVNFAVRLDDRTRARADLRRGDDPCGLREALDPSVRLQHFVFSPESFRVERQAGSRPCPDAGPLTGVLCDEHAAAAEHARKRLKDRARPLRHAPWRLIGIRPEFRPGTFIERVELRGGDGRPAGDPYAVRAPVLRAVYDFPSQYTILEAE